MALLCGFSCVRAAESERYSEDAVKAVFLYRFTGFVDWPADGLPGPAFEFAVLGADAVGDALERVLADHTVKGMPGRVRRIRSIRELGKAQLLYVESQSAADLSAVVQKTANAPVLLVSDLPHGLEIGSTVNFLLREQRVRFEVSLAAANRSGLRVSSELLAVATRVVGSAAGDAERRLPAQLTPAAGGE